MFFNRALSAFILPPGIFIFLGAVLFLLRNRRTSFIRRILIIGIPVLLYLLSIRPVEDLLLSPLNPATSIRI